MPKPALDEETYDHVKDLYQHAREHEWVRGYDTSRERHYEHCPSCNATVWPYRDGDDPSARQHRAGCHLLATLTFMETWLNIEGDLYREQDDKS